MKKILLIVIILSHVAVAIGSEVESPEKRHERIQQERTQALMDKLEVTPMNNKNAFHPDKPIFSKECIKGVTLHQIWEPEGCLSFEGLYFRINGQTNAHVEILYRDSQKTAQLDMFGDLAGCNLPLQALVVAYSKVSDGPGDLCLALVVKLDSNKTLEECTPRVFFTRANIRVSVISDVPEISAMEVAREVDKILIEAIQKAK